MPKASPSKIAKQIARDVAHIKSAGDLDSESAGWIVVELIRAGAYAGQKKKEEMKQ